MFCTDVIKENLGNVSVEAKALCVPKVKLKITCEPVAVYSPPA